MAEIEDDGRGNAPIRGASHHRPTTRSVALLFSALTYSGWSSRGAPLSVRCTFHGFLGTSRGSSSVNAFLQAPQVGSAKPFDDAHIFSVCGCSASVSETLVVEAHRIDNQRIALPTAHGVPLPRRRGVLRMLFSSSSIKIWRKPGSPPSTSITSRLGPRTELHRFHLGSKHDACWQAQRTLGHTRGEPLFPLALPRRAGSPVCSVDSYSLMEARHRKSSGFPLDVRGAVPSGGFPTARRK